MTAGESDLGVERDRIEVPGFRFESGAERDLRVAYETYGDPGAPAVLVAHALTGSHHVATVPDPEALPYDPPQKPVEGQAAGWWSDVVGPGRPIDTDRYFVVAVNVPGSPYGTTSPATPPADAPGAWPDADGVRIGDAYPAVAVADWTRAQRAVVDYLGIDRLHAVVGGSVGGLNALDWARRHPDRVERVVPIAAAPRVDPQVLAIDAVRRRAVETAGEDGLALARQLGHALYRSKDSLARQFGRDPADGDPTGRFADAAAEPYLAVASYLDYNGEQFAERFDPTAYLRLLDAMDGFDLADGQGSDAAALSGFGGEALVVSFAGDWHFTVEGARAAADAVQAGGGQAVHHVVDSDYGHDAFLVESGTFEAALSAFLASGVAGVPSPDGGIPGRVESAE
ncbi:MAG: homoserine O-acetyltransferase [Halobacteriales archaeon]